MIEPANISTRPGCYLFRDKDRNVIYVGKAKDLRKRVSSYFNKNNHDSKTEALVKQIDDVDYIITDNETEAFILENNLIKKYKPKYNINLKDSKRYTYILLTDEDFPRLLKVREKKLKGKYYGPFTSGFERKELMNFLNKAFMLRTCKRMPKKACLRYHIKLCRAPCIEMIGKEEYRSNINKVKSVLKGSSNELIKNLEKDMKKASSTKNFEEAITLRDQINGLKYLSERQKMERDKKFDEDILNFILRDDKVYLMLFNVKKGILFNKQEFVFDWVEAFLEEFIVQYYSDNPVPKEIILPNKVNSGIKEFLKKKRANNVFITIPKIGEKKILLSLVKKNIETSNFGDISKLEAIKSKLRLNDTPYVIECFDISHISGTSTVGSMVQFRNGKPDKNNYRRFKIRSYSGVDDYLGIAEIVRRRYNRLKSEQISMPNLIIIDGGKGQLNSALLELEKLELKIPVISIAKREEEIYVPGLSIPIKLKKKDEALKFIQSIRDEAHRFAISYNQLLRSKFKKI